ncbi:Maf family protein [Nesterenkonia marinintestina]|uniref:Maf family protein n=1 Tax=Nesterenkonia marinintestina TaxID=2979865 RepID=UPI0021BF43CE|nr:Maf family protein [Nesterenkonia sp. GX14115]
MTTPSHPTEHAEDPVRHSARSSADRVPLILASASPGRAQVLEGAGLDFSVEVSSVDEDEVLSAARALADAEDVPAEEVALLLARAKAEDVAARPPGRGALVLGCDSVFELDGQTYGKPYEPEIAVQRWLEMRGRTGTLHSGHWLIGPDGDAVGRTVSTRVSFAEPAEEEIRAYAESGEPMHCAGAFTIDGRGAAFVTGVEGDHLSVIGVSPHVLARLLAELGRGITDHWRGAASLPNQNREQEPRER